MSDSSTFLKWHSRVVVYIRQGLTQVHKIESFQLKSSIIRDGILAGVAQVFQSIRNSIHSSVRKIVELIDNCNYLNSILLSSSRTEESLDHC